VLDLPSDISPARQPVLVDRQDHRRALPSGGKVRTAIKVPSGWLVKRYTSQKIFELLHLRDGQLMPEPPLATGDALVSSST
jgi:hypothetical protein